MVFAEALTEYLIDGLSEALAKADEPAPPVPLAVDRYIALSALQKAIRRGHEDLALRAAMNLMIGGPHAIWRRLGIIAFEDIGVANIDAVDRPSIRYSVSASLKTISRFLLDRSDREDQKPKAPSFTLAGGMQWAMINSLLSIA